MYLLKSVLVIAAVVCTSVQLMEHCGVWLLLQIPMPNSPPWYSLFGAAESNIHIICRSILKLYTRHKVSISVSAAVSYSSPLPTVAALCEQANEYLFHALKLAPIHSFCRLLLPEHTYTVIDPCLCISPSFHPESPAMTSVILFSVCCTGTVFF